MRLRISRLRVRIPPGMAPFLYYFLFFFNGPAWLILRPNEALHRNFCRLQFSGLFCVPYFKKAKKNYLIERYIGICIGFNFWPFFENDAKIYIYIRMLKETLHKICFRLRFLPFFKNGAKIYVKETLHKIFFRFRFVAFFKRKKMGPKCMLNKHYIGFSLGFNFRLALRSLRISLKNFPCDRITIRAEKKLLA